jgi:CRISPR system Cascade subunit CasE
VFLSRLVLNTVSREVGIDLVNCQAMHRRLLDAFPREHGGQAAADARARHGLLFRLDSDPRTRALTVLAQSSTAPDWSLLPAGYLAPDSPSRPNPTVKAIDDRYQRLRSG